MQNQLEQLPDEIFGYKILNLMHAAPKAAVFKCSKDDQLYTLKIFLDKNRYEQIEKEIKQLNQIYYAYVVNCVEVFYFQEMLCSVSVFITNSLEEYIYLQPNHQLSEEAIMRIFRCICYGIQVIHVQGILHNNLRLDTILMDEDNPKITGLGTVFHEDFTVAIILKRNIGYLAPEVLNSQPFNQKIDVWSLGVILFKMIYGVLPFGQQSRFDKQFDVVFNLTKNGFDLNEVLKFLKIENPRKISDDTINLLKKMLEFNQEARLDINQLTALPYITPSQNLDLPKPKELNFPSLKIQLGRIVRQSTLEMNDDDRFTASRQSAILDLDLITSLMLAKNKTFKRQSVFMQNKVEIFQKYNYLIIRYAFMTDFYNHIKENLKFILFISNAEFVFTKYFLIKTVLFYGNWIKYILTSKENFFGLSNVELEELFKSDNYNQMVAQISKDVSKYEILHQELYQDCLELKDSINQEISQCIVKEVLIDYEGSMENLPEEYKIPNRAIMFNVFGTLYDYAQKIKKQQIKLKGTDDVTKQKQWRDSEGLIKLQLALKVLICLSINRVFDAKNGITRLQAFESKIFASIEDIIKYLHKTTLETAEEEIKYIFSKLYKNLNYQNLQKYELLKQLKDQTNL